MDTARYTFSFGLVLVLGLWTGEAHALDLTLPGEAILTHEVDSPADTYYLPVGPYVEGELPTHKVEGRLVRQAWRIDGQDFTTLELLVPLRAQLVESGYDILFDCNAEGCGGFDFRFNTSVLPAPDMFVDLFDYRFLSARKTGAKGVEYVSVLVSISGGAGYVQLIAAGDGFTARSDSDAAPEEQPTPTAPGAPLGDRILSEGHVILSDLEFATGSATLANGTYDSLAALAVFLKADERRRVALVGHTDTVGGLDTNVALSRRRAASVLDRLVGRYGVPRVQLESNGMGYLSPVAPNITAAGREANRRVEAVLLNAE